MPKVSVIIPNYNHSDYLHQRIESVLNQSYQDFELILLDDKSTDDSTVIITSYRDHPKVTQIIINEENSGNTFKQWEKGIAASVGELIWIAESDDWCE
ncbi:MAG: glycosyltransferase family 2 protein, partial [Pedobacter sp.]|nr:glycosyltransferase family 2 protein [Pedobacter sp.]